jgi:hypothetical protein
VNNKKTYTYADLLRLKKGLEIQKELPKHFNRLNHDFAQNGNMDLWDCWRYNIFRISPENENLQINFFYLQAFPITQVSTLERYWYFFRLFKTFENRPSYQTLNWTIRDTHSGLFNTLAGQFLKKGKKQRFTKMLFFLWFNLKLLMQLEVLTELEAIVSNLFQLPYDLGKRHLSNRVYVFPQPPLKYKTTKFFYRKFAARVKQQFGTSSQKYKTFQNKFLHDLLEILFLTPTNFIFTELTNYLILGHKNRMFVHYRWRRFTR